MRASNPGPMRAVAVFMATSVIAGWIAAVIVSVFLWIALGGVDWVDQPWVRLGRVCLVPGPLVAGLVAWRWPLVSFDSGSQFSLVVVLVTTAAPFAYWLGHGVLIFAAQ
jgi:hypothetical protein